METLKMDEQQVMALVDQAVVRALGDVEALLAPLADKMTATLRDYMDSTVAALEDRMVAIEDVATAPGPTTTSGVPGATESPDPLEARLVELEKQLETERSARAQKEAEASELRFQQALDQILTAYGPNQRAIVGELLAQRLKPSIKETAKGWMTKEGRTLEETVGDFFSSDQGKYFLPSAHQDGTGVRQPSAQPVPANDLDAALMKFFAG